MYSKQRSIKCILLAMILFSFLIVNVYTVHSNPVIAMTDAMCGDFFPINETDIQMVAANVEYIIDSTDIKNQINVHYKGSYVFNSSTATQNHVIAVPFTNFFDVEEESIQFKMNGLDQNYTLVKLDYEEAINMSEGTGIDYYYFKTLIYAEVFFEQSSNNTLDLSFDSTVVSEHITYLQIEYVVGTSRMWANETSEVVKFVVNGEQPESYLFKETSSSQTCSISETDEGKQYIWEWNNERIQVDAVWISFKIDHFSIDFDNPFVWITLAVGILVLPILLFLFLKKVIKSRKKKFSD